MHRDAYSQVQFDLIKGFVWLGYVSVIQSFYPKVAGIEDEIIQDTLLRFNGLKLFLILWQDYIFLGAVLHLNIIRFTCLRI